MRILRACVPFQSYYNVLKTIKYIYMKGTLMKKKSIISLILVAALTAAAAVSYTHLDVYKRQMQC